MEISRRKGKRQHFLKSVKPDLLDKILYREQVTLIENDKIISEDSDAAQSLNSSFSSTVTNLKIREYTDSN